MKDEKHMSTKDSSRESHFPAIEKKHGEPMKYWFAVMAKIADQKYPQQIAHLREKMGRFYLIFRLCGEISNKYPCISSTLNQRS